MRQGSADRKVAEISLMDVKRESGASPEQSRCCKLQAKPQPVKKESLCGGKPHGKTEATGSKSEDLPSRYFEALEEEAEK